MLCFSGFELYSRWVPLGFKSHDIGDHAQVQCAKGCKRYSPEKSELVYLQNTYIQWIPSDLSGG